METLLGRPLEVEVRDSLEKAMKNPKFRRSMHGLEKVAGKAVKGGIWVSGTAARAQGALDKVVGIGDTVHGVLSEVHDLAPGLSHLLGDNAAGHFVGKMGEWAGKTKGIAESSMRLFDKEVAPRFANTSPGRGYFFG